MCILGCAAALADSAPDPRLTPGAIATTDPAVICVVGYGKRHRVWHDKAGTLAKYGIPLSDAGLYEDDDLVPVCLGGDNADPRNHWPQPIAEAGAKDQDEADMCRAACLDHHDRALIEEDQRYFIEGKWKR
jgi:hypothetical protein